LATGTGDVAVALAESILNTIDHRDELNLLGMSITGVDPSRNMLRIAEEKVGKKKLSSMIQLRLGDGVDLHSFKAGEFNLLTISFGIRNIANRAAALSEMFRVLSPSGRKGGACLPSLPLL
jgi:demethylmenaquinone methyltransferase/2-methoxy-6-polyprenyl-1,4-benzoquinol methylase